MTAKLLVLLALAAIGVAVYGAATWVPTTSMVDVSAHAGVAVERVVQGRALALEVPAEDWLALPRSSTTTTGAKDAPGDLFKKIGILGMRLPSGSPLLVGPSGEGAERSSDPKN
jgi:hypothetical protein